MSITQTSLAEILREHVTLEVESIDRMYLNVYIPKLQRESGASWFLKQQRQYPVASSAAMAPISRAFVEAIESYAQTHQLPLLTFGKGQRKEDIVAPYLQRAAGREGIVLIGKAQEKTTTFRTTKGHGDVMEGKGFDFHVELPQVYSICQTHSMARFSNIHTR